MWQRQPAIVIWISNRCKVLHLWMRVFVQVKITKLAHTCETCPGTANLRRRRQQPRRLRSGCVFCGDNTHKHIHTETTALNQWISFAGQQQTAVGLCQLKLPQRHSRLTGAYFRYFNESRNTQSKHSSSAILTSKTRPSQPARVHALRVHNRYHQLAPSSSSFIAPPIARDAQHAQIMETMFKPN